MERTTRKDRLASMRFKASGLALVRRGRFVPFTSKADRGMAVEGTKAGSDK